MMFGNTIQRYIFRYVFKITFYLFLGISLLVFLVDFTEMNNRLSGVAGFSVQLGLSLAAIRLPFIIQFVVPFVILASTMTTLMSLNRKNELVVARSVGLSAWQFLTPIWVFAFLAGCFVILVLNPLAANGMSKALEIESALRGKPATHALADKENSWLRQEAPDGGIFLIGAERVSPNGLKLFNAVFIEIDANEQIINRYDAPTASLGDKVWLLDDVIESKSGAASAKIGSKQIPTKLDPSVVTDALVSPTMIPFFKLGNQIEKARAFGVSSASFLMQYHSLIARPALLISMTLIAATVSLRFARFGVSSSMILGGIVAGIVLYVVTEVTYSFGGAGIISPVVAAWLPVLASGMFGVAYILHREDG